MAQSGHRAPVGKIAIFQCCGRVLHRVLALVKFLMTPRLVSMVRGGVVRVRSREYNLRIAQFWGSFPRAIH